MKNFIIYWFPTFLWMGFLFPSNDALTVSSTSCIIVPIIKWLFPHADQATVNALHILTRKSVHFFEYALLAFLLFRAFRGRNKSWQWQWILYAGIITIGYGALDEFLQTLIPSRTGSFSDWMINSAGVIFSLSILSLRNRKNLDEVFAREKTSTLGPRLTESSQVLEMETYIRRNHLSNEIELLYLLSRVHLHSLALEKAQALINSTFDWDSFITLSIKHGTSALIYKNLLNLKNIPQNTISKFCNIYNNLLRSNILMVSELDRLIDGLNKKGIEVISLKGATASEEIFEDIGLYPSGDIDILVKVKDIDRVRGYLKSEGYKLNDIGFDEYREFFIKELYHINLSNGIYTIEPHWNLFMRYFTTPPGFWWEESITVQSEDRQYRFLSPEKYILYTSFRLFYKGFVHLRFLVLIAEILRHYRDEIDWNKLFSYARKYKFENVLKVTMKMSGELLGAPVPSSYSIIRGLRAKVLYQWALKMVLKEGNIHPLNKVLFMFLRDDFSGALKVFFRRLFPSMGEIVSRYRLSPKSGKAIAYYILNPIFLMIRKHQKLKNSKKKIGVKPTKYIDNDIFL